MAVKALGEWPVWLAYVSVFFAAALEGEVVFLSACVLAGLGHLGITGVMIAGALGGSAGDQFFFYAFRGRMRAWLDRFPPLARRREAVLGRVRSNAVKMALACRFLPGLRIAIPVACACAGVSPARFSICSLIGSFAWAGGLVWTVTRLGPEALAHLGFRGWWSPVIPALLILGFFYWLGRSPAVERRLGGERPPKAPSPCPQASGERPDAA